MRLSGAFSFDDPEDYESALHDARVELVVSRQGGFRACLSRVALPHLQLVACSETLPRIAYVAMPFERVCITFPTRADSPLIWGGVTIRRGDVVFHSRGEGLHQRTSGRTNWNLLSLDPAHLMTVGRALTGSRVAAPLLGRILRPDHHRMAQLIGLCAAATRLAERRPHLLGDPDAARGLEHDLIEALIGCLTSADERQNVGHWPRGKEAIDRLEAVLSVGPTRMPSMPELAASAGVSERVLRLYCADFLGISPRRYLFLRRLRLARIALRSDGAAATTVTEVAQRCGFSSMGRFAGAYRAAFGQTPSATLRLKRNRRTVARTFSESG